MWCLIINLNQWMNKTSTIHKTDKAEIVISASSLNQTTSKFYLTFYGITPPYQRELKSDMIKKLPNILFMYNFKIGRSNKK